MFMIVMVKIDTISLYRKYNKIVFTVYIINIIQRQLKKEEDFKHLQKKFCL